MFRNTKYKLKSSRTIFLKFRYIYLHFSKTQSEFDKA